MPLPDHISLSQLTDEIRGVFTNAFQGKLYWVTAEISNLSFYRNKGTWYFDLCEKDLIENKVIAILRSVAFGTAADEITEFERLTNQKFGNGLQVLIQVELGFHEVYGLQLRMRKVDPYYTLGNLERQRQLTLEKLVRDNPEHISVLDGIYQTKNKWVGLPLVFKNLALISSANSAGLQDFRHTLDNNNFKYKFKIDTYFTEVQGAENAGKMVEQLVKIFRSQIKYDAVAILRGGGAQSDFLLFDTYEIARAVARFPIPVITGIGHQKNETIVDLMACKFTKTPTQAAEFIISVNRSFEENIISLRRNMLIRVQQKLAIEKDAISRLSKVFTRDSVKLIENDKLKLSRAKNYFGLLASACIQKSNSQLINETQRLISGMAHYKKEKTRILEEYKKLIPDSTFRFISNRNSYLSHYKALFDLMDIKKTLSRGFAIVRSENVIISESSQIKPGQMVTIEMQDGILDAQIKSSIKPKN